MTGCLDFLGNSFYPLRGGVADCLGMVFLQVVKARDCRPIFVRRTLEDAGFSISDATIAKMWVPVEVVIGEKA